MKRSFLLVLVLVVGSLLSACDTLDTSSDASAAQQLQPTISGFERSSADSIVDAITRVGAGAALTSGAGAPASAAIARAETVLQCFQDVGAVDASIYVQQNVTDIVPNAGASVVINNTRVNRNLIQCLTTGTNTDGPVGGQSVSIVPCASSGQFTYNNEEFAYLFVGVGDQICNAFNAHFNTFNPTPVEFGN